MKNDLKLLLAVVTALGLPVAAHAAATLTQAQITQIIKDVKTIDPGKGARPAVMKETLQGEQAVRTGIESRAELFFNDHTITRLGANTHFSFTEGTRNMSLQSGVMLLQVPKGIGGAKIETAAVTAAVTGTTIMFEAGKDYTKLIVLEGECCLWLKDDKKDNRLIKFKHKTCVLEGQELILRNGAKTIPDPVYVNLKVLESTSLLLTGNWGAPLNNGPITTAAAGQGPGNYIPTNLAIIGAGTDVTVIQGQTPNTPPSPPSPPAGSPGGTPPPFTPPGKYGLLGTIPGPYTIGAGSIINTDPKIIFGGVTSYGRVYRGSILDGSPTEDLFGVGTTVSFPGKLNVDSDFPNYGVAAFKFTSLNISGNPSFQISGNGATDLALVSLGAITLSSASPVLLDFSQLRELDFFTAGGNINVGPNITIMVNRLQLYSFGAGNNITIDGAVNLFNSMFTDDSDDKFTATTQGTFSGTGSINNASTIDVQAGGVLTLAETGGGEEEGPQVDTLNGVTIDTSSLGTLNLTANEIDITNGFFAFAGEESLPDVTLIATAGNDLPGNITLSGNINVDSLTATAANNITADASSNIGSYNSVQLTAGNNVEIDGGMNAGSITATGNNVTTGSASNLYSYNEIQLTATNGNVEIGGMVNAYPLTASASNDVDTGANASIYSNGFTAITATNGEVTLGGKFESFSSLTVQAAGDVTIPGGASITTDNGTFQITSGSAVEIDGGVTTNALIVKGTGNIATGSDAKISVTSVIDGEVTTGGTARFTSTTGNVTLDGVIGADAAIIVNGHNVNLLSTDTDNEDNISTNFLKVTASGSVKIAGTVSASTLDVKATNNVLVANSATINTDAIKIKAGGALEVDGVIQGNGGSGGSVSATSFKSESAGAAPGGMDFFSSGSTGSINAQKIKITSAGDLMLVSPEFAGSPTVNGVAIDPNDDLTKLNLIGATVEVPNGLGNVASTLKLTSTNGDITIAGGIGLGGTNFSGAVPTKLNVSASGNIVFTDIATNDADTLSFTAKNQILGDFDASANNLTVGASNADFNLGQNGAGSTIFFLHETAASGTTEIGGAQLTLVGSSPVLSVSADSLVLSDDFSGISGLTLNLTSATDINSGTSSTISNASSVSLKVGAGATLTGGEGTIIYNGGQLAIDDSSLGAFSVTASSIDVDEGFPSLPGDSLDLTAGGGITINTPLTIGSGAFITDAGTIDIEAAITTGSTGSLTLTSTNGGITVNGSLQIGTGGIALSATNGSVNVNDPVTTGAGGNLTITGSNITVATGAPLTTTGSGSLTLTASGSISVNDALTTGAGGSVTITAGTGDIDLSGTVQTGSGGSVGLTSSNGNITTNDPITTGSGGSLTLSATGGAIYANSSLTATGTGALNIAANGAVILQGTLLTGSGGGITITSNNGNVIADNSITTGSGGNLFITGNNVTTFGSLTTGTGDAGAGGNLTLIVNHGGINILGDLSVGGSFTGSATGNITIENTDPVIGTSMKLTSGGAIEVDEDITINGPLTLDAGTFIRTNFSSTIFGATQVTLTLGAPAEISETQNDGVSTLFFDAASGEDDDEATLAIDLTKVISTFSSVSATAPALTLSTNFDEPNISLTLTANGGDLALNGDVTTSSFSGFASGAITGNSTIIAGSVTLQQGAAAMVNQPSDDLLSVGTLSIDLNPDDGGATSLTLSAGPLTLASDLAISGIDLTLSGVVDSAGHVITAQNVILENLQTTTGTSGNATNLDVNANSLTLSNVSLNGSGTGSGGTLTGVTPNGVATPGFVPAEIILDFNDINVSGAVTANGGPSGGNGGTVTLNSEEDINVNSYDSESNFIGGFISTNGGGSGAGGTINLTSGGNINLSGPLTANGGPSGGAGGTVHLNSQGDINVNDFDSFENFVNGSVSADGGDAGSTSGAKGGNGGMVTGTAGGAINVDSSISANGGAGNSVSGAGGNGGTLNLNSAGDTTINGFVNASGGNAGAGGAGGNGGTVGLTSGSGGSITVNNNIFANGGDAGSTGGAAGGSGGTVNLLSGGDINVNSIIGASTGINGNTKWTGGAGGTVNLTAQGEVNVNSTIEVSSSDLFTNRVSAKGGNINVTSHAVTGVAINIADTGQLNALLNQGAVGPGGAITFRADKGGNIKIAGKVRADAGGILVQTGTADGTGPGGSVCLYGANLSADVVKVGSLGSNGTLIIGNNTRINGDTAIQLYAAGSNGSVDFTGNTYLTGASIKSIAGNTVTINYGATVNVTGGAATVYTNNANYSNAGGTGSALNYGSFSGNANTTTKPYASRPGF